MRVKFLFFLVLASLGFAEEHCFEGTHFIASYCGCNLEALEDHTLLAKAMKEAAVEAGATVIDEVDYHFSPNGYTLVLLLSESHASIHTYPEHKACFVDFFTCGTKCCPRQFDQVLRAYLEPQEVDSCVLKREDQSCDF